MFRTLKNLKGDTVLAVDDTVTLADGVVLVEQGVADALRGTAITLNPVARAAFEVLPATIGDIAARFVALGADPDRARADAFRLVADLDAAYLVTVKPSGNVVLAAARSFAAAVPMALAGVLPRPPRFPASRTQLPSHGRAARSAAAALSIAPVAARVFALAFALAITGLTGISGFALDALGIATLLAGSMTLGLVVHETAHAAALPSSVPAALVTRGLYAAIVHPPCGEQSRRRTALAGPLASAALGVCVVTVGAFTASAIALIAALPLLSHVLSLSAFSADGRNAAT